MYKAPARARTRLLRFETPIRGSKSAGCTGWWGQRDLNPHRRVSTTGGATSREIDESSLQLFIITQQQQSNHAHNWSPLVYQVSLYPHWVSLERRLTSCAFLLLSSFSSSSSCAISNAGYHVSSRRANFSSYYSSLPDRSGRALGGPVGTFGSFLGDFRTRGVWLRRPALYPG